MDSLKAYSSFGVVKSNSVETLSSFQKQDGNRGFFVGRGVREGLATGLFPNFFGLFALFFVFYTCTSFLF